MRRHEVVEHLEDLTRTGWPIVGVLLETTFYEHGQGLGDICSFCHDRRRHVDDVSANQRCDRTGKGRLPRDHLVGNAAERVEIDPVVEPCICGGLLGRHVERCSNHNSQVGPRRRNGHCMRSQQGLGDSKIRNGGGIAGEQDVVWLDVPVHDTFGVRELQRARDVSENADRSGDRHGARTHEMHPERLPFDERHRVVGQPFVSPVVNTGRMCGCCSWAVSSISCLKRSKFTPAARSGESTFTTTRRQSARSSARNTRLIPPPPSSRSTR